MSDYVKKIRVHRGLSQAEVAEKLDITQASYARIEQGKTKLNTTRIEQLAQIFDVSKEYFVSGNTATTFQDMDAAFTNEYIKKLVAINQELRQKIDGLIKNEITYLREQNRQLIELLEKNRREKL